MVRYILLLWFVFVGALSAAQVPSASPKLNFSPIKQLSEIEKNIRAGDWLVLVNSKADGAVWTIDPKSSHPLVVR